MEFQSELSADLRRYLTEAGAVDPHWPDCPDLEELWPGIAEAYLPDGLREFADFPMVSLGWIAFVGMAMACLWDSDWSRVTAKGPAGIYAELRDARGFDAMDDHILEDVMPDTDEASRSRLSTIIGEAAARTLHRLRTSAIAPGSAEALEAYIASLRELYIAGIAIGLRQLGYHMTAL